MAMSMRRVVAALAAIGLVSAGVLAAAPSASADVDSASANPSVWVAGSSPTFTVTLETSSQLDGSVGFWTGEGNQGFGITYVGSSAGTLVGDTVTCAGSGITYRSSALEAFTPDTYSDLCETRWSGGPTDYVDSWLQIADLGAVTGNYTFTITVPAGVYIAPAAPGTYAFEAYGYNGTDVRANFNIVVSAASHGGNTARYLQQMGLPESGSCDVINDSDLGWGTSLSGGWAKAWGEWMNDGMGGWACSRTIAWSRSAGAWVIAS